MQVAIAYPSVSGFCDRPSGQSGQMLRMDNHFVFVRASRHHIHVTVDVCADLEPGVKAARDRVNRRLGKRRVF